MGRGLTACAVAAGIGLAVGGAIVGDRARPNYQKWACIVEGVPDALSRNIKKMGDLRVGDPYNSVFFDKSTGRMAIEYSKLDRKEKDGFITIINEVVVIHTRDSLLYSQGKTFSYKGASRLPSPFWGQNCDGITIMKREWIDPKPAPDRRKRDI